MRLPRVRSHSFVHTYSHPQPITEKGLIGAEADDVDSDDHGHGDGVFGFKSQCMCTQVGSAAGIDDSRVSWLVSQRFLSFFNALEYPEEGFGRTQMEPPGLQGNSTVHQLPLEK